jgi:hypothetical protein
MGIDVTAIEEKARKALSEHGVGLAPANQALLTILIGNLNLIRELDAALAQDGPLVVLPNGIKTAHPALRPRDVAIRRALGLAKELGVVQQQPPMTAEESPYTELLKGYRRA